MAETTSKTPLSFFSSHQQALSPQYWYAHRIRFTLPPYPPFPAWRFFLWTSREGRGRHGGQALGREAA